MSKPRHLSQILVFAVVGLLSVGIGIWAAGKLIAPEPAPEPPAHATYIEGGIPIVDFQLVDHFGERFDNARLREHWTFMFFGFTYCPDICPMTLSVLDQVERRLQTEYPELPMQVVFVSVDPARDTPERLGQYVPYFNPGFLGVTGAEAQIERLSRQLGILYIHHEDEDGDGNYMVDHSSAVLLIDPNGRFSALFPAPHLPDTLYQDLLRIERLHRIDSRQPGS